MKFTLSINMDSAAFDEGAATELLLAIERIKQRIKPGISDGNDCGAVFDSNGNLVGKWAVR